MLLLIVAIIYAHDLAHDFFFVTKPHLQDAINSSDYCLLILRTVGHAVTMFLVHHLSTPIMYHRRYYFLWVEILTTAQILSAIQHHGAGTPNYNS